MLTGFWRWRLRVCDSNVFAPPSLPRPSSTRGRARMSLSCATASAYKPLSVGRVAARRGARRAAAGMSSPDGAPPQQLRALTTESTRNHRDGAASIAVSRAPQAAPAGAFPLSSLGPEVRDLLWVPPAAAASAASAGTIVTPPPHSAPGRGLHSSTFRLNVSAFYGIGGALRGSLGGV